jgi:hypothetical protein
MKTLEANRMKTNKKPRTPRAAAAPIFFAPGAAVDRILGIPFSRAFDDETIPGNELPVKVMLRNSF